MKDQAEGLRHLVQTHQDRSIRQTRIITVTSGKGGVGKSNFTLNFALSLQAQGYKVLVFDADIGLANIDVLMGVPSSYNLYHLLKREKTIWEIIQKGANGLEFIAGGSGFTDLLRLTEEELNYFSEQISELHGYADFIIFDTGAGLSKETLQFILASEETIVVTTPEPTSITDAYAIIKMVTSMGHQVSFKLVINRVTDAKEGRQTADKISLVAHQFLDLQIPTLGFIEDDAAVSKAVRKQVPFSLAFPNSAAAVNIRAISEAFVGGYRTSHTPSSGVKSFLNKMMRLLK
ncbi:MinD/ParA family protein [Paenibacillus oryzisoli]|uniref:MinD/ParA family protein n=1 Tax=Paenibacillus oryzisoli TaxID=1850517 RepID=UPI003D2AC3D2